MMTTLSPTEILRRVEDAVEPALWALTSRLSTRLPWGHAALDLTRSEALPFAACVDLSPSGERADALTRLSFTANRDGVGFVLVGALIIGEGAPKAQTTRLRVGPEGVSESTLTAWLAEADALILLAETPLSAIGRGVFGE
jgi:hypothetical protein